jgi:hypothetical protein
MRAQEAELGFEPRLDRVDQRVLAAWNEHAG